MIENGIALAYGLVLMACMAIAALGHLSAALAICLRWWREKRAERSSGHSLGAGPIIETTWREVRTAEIAESAGAGTLKQIR